MSNKNIKRSQAVRNSLTSLLFFFSFILAACGGADLPISDPTEPGSSETPSPEALATDSQPVPTQTESINPALGEPFSLTVGQGTTIGETGLAISFDMVERDGRCPSAVLCAENGPVVILISAAIGEQFSTQYEMNPDANLAALAGMAPNIITHNKYEIELTAVNPYPEQPEDLMNMAYEATFIVR